MTFFFLFLLSYFIGVIVGIYAYARQVTKAFDEETERVRKEHLARLRGEK